jgi:hypothetical protein
MPGRNGSETAPLAMRLARIYDRLGEIFVRAASERRPPEAIAEQMARELIARATTHWQIPETLDQDRRRVPSQGRNRR